MVINVEKQSNIHVMTMLKAGRAKSVDQSKMKKTKKQKNKRKMKK